MQSYFTLNANGRALNFFSDRGVRPRFPKCKACELIIASQRGVLGSNNFQIWGSTAKIWVKIEVAEAKISYFFSKEGGL